MLSKAESSVANYIKQGLSNKDIADILCVCEKTIKFHITNIYLKESVKSRSEFLAKQNGAFVSKNEILNDKKITKKDVIMNHNDSLLPASQNQRSAQLVGRSQEDKISFIDDKFKVGETIGHLHLMMKEVTRSGFNPNTINAACNCVARINETVNTTIQAAKFLSDR